MEGLLSLVRGHRPLILALSSCLSTPLCRALCVIRRRRGRGRSLGSTVRDKGMMCDQRRSPLHLSRHGLACPDAFQVEPGWGTGHRHCDPTLLPPSLAPRGSLKASVSTLLSCLVRVHLPFGGTDRQATAALKVLMGYSGVIATALNVPGGPQHLLYMRPPTEPKK